MGKFFSWLTIFIILFAIFISPLIEYNFKLSLCKNIYDKGTPLEQSAIHMLFLKASDYVQDFYYSRQKRTKAPNISAEVRRKNVLAFLNFDKEPLSNSDMDSVGAH